MITGGIVALDDLRVWRADMRTLPQVLGAIGIDPSAHPRVRALGPFPRMVVLSTAFRTDELVRMRPWLRQADQLWVLREMDPDLDDPDRRAAVEAEWQQAAEGLPIFAMSWFTLGDLDPVRVALDWAQEGRAQPLPGPSAASFPTFEPGPWLPTRHEADVPSFVFPDGAPAVRLQDGPHFLHLSAPAPLDLLSARLAPREPSLDETRFQQIQRDQRLGIRMSGGDPRQRLVGAGYRSTHHWIVDDPSEPYALCRSVLDWPCGHARKLWGYSTNQPAAVAVAPDGGAQVSTFTHDTLLSSTVPLQWRLWGGVAVSTWPGSGTEDPLRALFFRHDPDVWGPVDPADPDDDDARTKCVTVALGPTRGLRYAVALHDQTWRITGGASARIDRGTPEYGVFDDQHRCVRRAPGRLLGGWWGQVTVVYEGALWRDDLVSGTRTRITDLGRAVARAWPVPETHNVLLVADHAVRLV